MKLQSVKTVNSNTNLRKKGTANGTRNTVASTWRPRIDHLSNWAILFLNPERGISMTYTITLTIPVLDLTNTTEAKEMAESLIEHLAETYNDDDSLDLNNAHFTVERKVR